VALTLTFNLLLNGFQAGVYSRTKMHKTRFGAFFIFDGCFFQDSRRATGDDERLAIAMSLDIRCRFLQAARPHQVDCGNVELECRHDGLRMISH